MFQVICYPKKASLRHRFYSCANLDSKPGLFVLIEHIKVKLRCLISENDPINRFDLIFFGIKG